MENKWISVKERLPAKNRQTNWHLVYVVSIGHGVESAVFNSKNKWMKSGYEITEDVTHWMPLPEPPKEN